MSLDPLVVPMVEYFNRHGLPTYMSCQGHNKTNMSMFWIEFNSSVTDEDIQRFMQAHLDWRGTFLSCGRFARRGLGCYSVRDRSWNFYGNWCYFAATPEAADADLKNWESHSDKWEGFEGERYKNWVKWLKFCGKL